MTTRQQRFKGGSTGTGPQNILNASDIEAMIADAVPDLSEGSLAYVADNAGRASEQPPVGTGFPNTVFVIRDTPNREEVAAKYPVLSLNASTLAAGTPVLIKKRKDGWFWIVSEDHIEADRAYQDAPPTPNLLLTPHGHTGGADGPQVDIVTGTTGDLPMTRGGSGSNLSATGPGLLYQPSAGAPITLIKANLGATTDPAASNDVSEGYSVFSPWVNITTNTAFICTQNDTSNAVWIEVGGSGGGGGGMEDFQLAGDSGTDTITDGETVKIEGGEGIETSVAGGTSTAVVRMNPSSLTGNDMSGDQSVLWANGSDVNLTSVSSLPYFPLNSGDWTGPPATIFAGLDELAAKSIVDQPYSPLNSGDWDGPPTTIAEALDELASRLRAIE